MTVCHELCKSGRTGRDAIWVLDSGGTKEGCIRLGCTLANTIELSVYGSDAAFLSNYFDHLLLRLKQLLECVRLSVVR